MDSRIVHVAIPKNQTTPKVKGDSKNGEDVLPGASYFTTGAGSFFDQGKPNNGPKWHSPFEKPIVIDIFGPFVIPGAGWSIGKHLRLGAAVKIQAIVLPLWVGIADFKLSLETSIPNSAMVSLDFFGDSSAVGFEGARFEPTIFIKALRGICRMVFIIAPTFEIGAGAPFGEFVALINVNPETNIGFMPIVSK